MSKLLYQSDKREHFAEATVNNPNHAAYLYFCPYQKPPVAIVFPPQEIFYTNCIDTVLSSFSGKHTVIVFSNFASMIYSLESCVPG